MRAFRFALMAAAAALAAAPSALAAPPGTPDLVPASDSGASATDNITNDTTPEFTIDAGAAAAGQTVTLCIAATGGTDPPSDRGAALVGPSGIVSITASPALLPGTYDVTARTGGTRSCTAGEVSATSLALDVRTTAPILASPPTLVDFVGANPALTFTSTPRFDVAAPTGTSVTLFEGTQALGTATAVDGVARVGVSTALAEGSHTVYAKATDGAGNTSTASPSFAFTVDSSSPAASTPDLVDDDGESAADDRTSNPRPRFAVATEGGALVTIYEDGLALGTARADDTGVALVRVAEIGWLDPGLHCVYAIAIDRVGNAGGETTALCVTILPGVAPFTTNLGVALVEERLTVSLRTTVAAKATVRVLHRGKAVARGVRTLAARRKAKIALRLPHAARGRLVVVATLRSADDRRRVVRRTVRR